MSKRLHWICAVLALLLLTPLAASAQQQEPAIYTFVAEWTIARAQWDAFTANFEKTSKPILDRFVADGTLVGWGSFATIVHAEDQPTHGTWWEATSMAGIEKVRSELVKQPPNPAIIGAKHWDYYLRSLTQKRKAGSGSGFLWVSNSKVLPGKGTDWRAFFDQTSKPVYDELFANGTIVMYSVDVEQVHTDDSGWRFVVYLSPNIEGMDKVNAAFQAANQKRTPEERAAIGAKLGELTAAGTHRDYFARVLSYTAK